MHYRFCHENFFYSYNSKLIMDENKVSTLNHMNDKCFRNYLILPSTLSFTLPIQSAPHVLPRHFSHTENMILLWLPSEVLTIPFGLHIHTHISWPSSIHVPVSLQGFLHPTYILCLSYPVSGFLCIGKSVT